MKTWMREAARDGFPGIFGLVRNNTPNSKKGGI